MNCDSEIPPS